MTDRTQEFIHVAPSPENYLRGVILFGLNTACYKFALGKALLGAPDSDCDATPLEALALPYAHEICEHLKGCDAQTTQPSSKFLNGCRAFNDGKLDEEGLRDVTLPVQDSWWCIPKQPETITPGTRGRAAGARFGIRSTTSDSSMRWWSAWRALRRSTAAEFTPWVCPTAGCWSIGLCVNGAI